MGVVGSIFFLGQWPLPLPVQALVSKRQLVAFSFPSPQSARAEDVDSHANKRLGCALFRAPPQNRQCAERACPLRLEKCCPCGFLFCMSDFRHWNACTFPQGATPHAVRFSRFTGNYTRNKRAIAFSVICSLRFAGTLWPGSCSSCGQRRGCM